MLRVITHALWGSILGIFIGFGLAYADGNTWQPLQPYKSNANQRINGCSCSTYFYGNPGGGCCVEEPDSNVIWQFLFDESSTDAKIVDEVSGVEVTWLGSAQVLFEQEVTGDYASLSPGITGALNTANRFEKSSRTSEFDIGTSDYTLEMWIKSNPAVQVFNRYFDMKSSVTGRGYAVVDLSRTTDVDDDRMLLYHTAEDDAAFNASWTGTDQISNNTMKKLRITVDRDGSAEYFIDGVSQGTTSVLGGSERTVNANNVTWFANSGGGSGVNGLTFFEARLTQGLTANSGGPGGG